MTKHCIITGDPITSANDSKAHVIPSALGGRLKPAGILSKDANTTLGDKIDLPLIQAFQSLMNLLNGSRDRGRNQPTRMTDDAGKIYLFEFGEPLSLAVPEYEETEEKEETRIVIKARNLKEARTLLGRVKAKHPAFDINEAMKHAVREQQWPDGMLRHQIQVGPSVLFPAVFVGASVFAAYHGQEPHPDLKSYVGSFDPDQPTMPPDTFYFMPPQSWVRTSSHVSHLVALLAEASAGRMLVYIELFNVVGVGVVMPFKGTSDIQETYAIDVLAGQTVESHLDKAALGTTPWSATHQLDDPTLPSLIKSKLDKLIQTAQKREWDAALEQIITRV